MVAREIYDFGLEKLLYELYFEIAQLKSRVERAGPWVSVDCKNQLKSLLDQYQIAETQVHAVREAKGEFRIGQIALAKNCLQELRNVLASVGRWIWIQTAD